MIQPTAPRTVFDDAVFDDAVFDDAVFDDAVFDDEVLVVAVLVLVLVEVVGIILRFRFARAHRRCGCTVRDNRHPAL